MIEISQDLNDKYNGNQLLFSFFSKDKVEWRQERIKISYNGTDRY